MRSALTIAGSDSGAGAGIQADLKTFSAHGVYGTTVAAMISELLPRAFLVTPNIPEAEALTGIAIRTDDDRRQAARRIAAMGPTAVLLKGGHLPGHDVRDLLCSNGELVEFRHERIAGGHTHGTGCTFAAALTAHIALGRTLVESVPRAQRYVAEAIRHAPALGRGNGPMNHFWATIGEPV